MENTINKTENTIDKNNCEKIFEKITIAVAICELITDKQGRPIDYRFLKINEAFEKQSGMLIETSIGKTIKEIFPDIELTWIKKFGSVVINNKPCQFIDFNHNTNKYYNARAFKLSGNTFTILLEDITEKLQAEKDLIKKNEELILSKVRAEVGEKRYSGLLQNLESGIVLHAPDTSILMTNSRATELLGLSDKQMKGKEAIDPAWKFIDESNLPLAIEEYPVNRIITRKGPIQNQIAGIYRPNTDDIVWVSVNGCPMFDSTGAISEIVISFIDITERKQTEKLTIESNRLNAIGEMAAAVAHDFNNSLQLMIGNLEIIKLQSNLLPTTHEHINNIESIIKDVASRTRSLQSFGDKKNNNKEFETFDLNIITAEIISQSRPIWKDQIEKKGIKINFLTDYGDIPKIFFNRGSLTSIIFNLIKNSIEAMPQGGTIKVKTGIKNEGVFLTCEDTGVGMTKESQLKIFQPYYSTKGYEIGRGLGMSGVYNILKKAKGSVKVLKTGIGEGSTIEIFFPITSMEKMKSIDETVPKKVSSLRVLYVDDQVLIGLNSQMVIELSGHQCDVEISAADALITLDKKQYDVVITDIGMPEMNGWEFAAAIREKFGDTIKIIAASGWKIEEKELIKNDINYSLMKPYSSEEIEKILGEIHKL